MHRRHDIDSLRVIAFALLIVYHTAMAYVDGWDFHLKSSYTVSWLQWPMIALNRWRMPLLFAISGIALGLALPAAGRLHFAWRRALRLLLPLLFGIVAVVSLQAYCEAVDKGDVAPGLAAFLWRYWQFRPWPEASFSGARYGFTWNHLWYLAYLIPYSLLTMLAATLLRTMMEAGISRWTPPRLDDRQLSVALVVLPVAWLAWTLLEVLPAHPPTHALLDDAYVHAESLPIFLGGFLLARWERGWSLLQRGRHWSLALAVAGLCIELGIRALARMPEVAQAPPWLLSLPWAQSERLGRALYTWTALLALLGWARVSLARPRRWLPWCREAIFPCYILHQTVLILLLYGLRPLQLGPWLEPALVLAGTLLGCAALYALVIRRVRWLRPLFGLPPQHPKRQADAMAAAGPATGLPSPSHYT